MNKKQLTQIFARAARRSPARAADEIDGLVYRMLKELKRPFTRQTIKERSTAAGSTGSKQER